MARTGRFELPMYHYVSFGDWCLTGLGYVRIMIIRWHLYQDSNLDPWFRRPVLFVH